mmetsp:Transcript_17544/g.20341  ORF Transcript_17544/g.20341 Transcript_17544/m.20341 type:complete len:117 (+) Transcript_17544:181-531(+)
MRFSRLESTVKNDGMYDPSVGNIVSVHNDSIWESKQLFSMSFARLMYQISYNYSFDKEGKDILKKIRSVNLHDFEELVATPSKSSWVPTFHRQALTILYFHTVLLRSNERPYLSEY